MATRNYHELIPWYELEAVIKERLSQAYIKLGNAEGDEVPKLQGRVKVLQEMLNLPEVLAGRAEDEEEARKHAVT